MGDVIQQALTWYNLPLTLLLVVIVFYWLMVIIGVLSADSFDFDIETADIDMGVDIDADADVDLDTDHDFSADHDIHADHGTGGIGLAVMKFLNFGQVPAMIVLTVLVICMWFVSMIANFALNRAGLPFLAIGFFFVNLLVSAVVTKIATAPLKPLFRSLNQNYDTHEPIVGRECVVRSSKVTTDSGQAEVEREGASFLINVRIAEGRDPLPKGALAIVADYDAEKDLYLIKHFTKPELEN